MQVILNILHYQFYFVIYKNFSEEYCTVTDTNLVYSFLFSVFSFQLPVTSYRAGKRGTGKPKPQPALSIRSYVPNFFTLCNLMCGCIGLVFIAKNELAIAAYLIWIAAALDFADGLAARALKAYSDIGKQLDSLADMVSFGVLPAYIMFALINARSSHELLPYVAFLIAAFSALRLAKFNIDTRQTNAFIGVPTPANALLISSLPLIAGHAVYVEWFQFLYNPWVLIALTLTLSYLLIANIELLAFKFKNMAWKGNEARYIFMIMTVLLFAFLGIAAVPIIFVLYLIVSSLKFLVKKQDRRPETEDRS